MAALGSWGLFVYTEFMDIELDPKDQRLLETLSSESGKPVEVLLRELLHEALTSKKRRGRRASSIIASIGGPFFTSFRWPPRPRQGLLTMDCLPRPTARDNLICMPRRAAKNGTENLTLADLKARAEAIALRAGLSGASEAFKKLDAGKLDGTLLEMELRMIRFLRKGTRSPRRKALTSWCQ